MKSTQAMRDQCRELSKLDQDDYDRAVVCILDDLEMLLRPSKWKSRAVLFALLPWLYPLRAWQARHGWPVDMQEFRREIGAAWRGIH